MSPTRGVLIALLVVGAWALTVSALVVVAAWVCRDRGEDHTPIDDEPEPPQPVRRLSDLVHGPAFTAHVDRQLTAMTVALAADHSPEAIALWAAHHDHERTSA